jgi:hypothetical protein
VSNKGTAYQFRNEVLLLLHERGFSTAVRVGEHRGQPKPVHGDIVGLPTTTAIRSGVSMDLAGAVQEAQREAEAEEHDVYVSVHKRRGHPVEDSFVVTTLDVWTRVLAKLHPEAVTTT